MKQLLRRPVFWIAVAMVVGIGAFSLMNGGDERTKLQLSRFQDLAADEKVKTAEIVGTGNVRGELTDGTKYEAKFPAEYADELTTQLLRAKVDVDSKDEKDNIWLSLLLNFLPILLLFGGFLFIINSMQGGGSKVMQFGKAKARLVSKDEPKVTFADVAGADEAIAELMEIKDFLESPAKFQAIGAKIPKGVLLYGPPGTGKTLLAKAVAGEAGVPFFSISGSDFVEMFVGVGASRVRDLFEQAKANPPAIIFMDEIDAVGRPRGAGLGGGPDEREQTLNQLLGEMDGVDTKAGVILLAATNRPDILDPALLRPGRFDRQIVVDRPDLEGRKKILGVHARGKPLEDAIDLEVLARRTPGFTGADLANLMNEAALLSARNDRQHIGMVELEDAIDRVIGGPERKTRVMSEKEKLVIAYHEGGHALVGHVLPNADPVHKVSIVARGRALGWTLSLPTEDKYIVSRSELRDQLGVLLGGRTAEELIFSEITTGAANDIEKATEIARAMVTQYGMSDVLGPQQLGQQNGEVFLGRDFGHQPNYSDEVASRIDAEVRHLIDNAHGEALAILTTHRAALDNLAAALMEKETLDTPALMEILGDLPPWAGTAEPVPPPRPRPTPPPDPGPSPEVRPPAAPVGALTLWRRLTGKPATV
ncbi:MAG TPA: ATP-dependent zinc metalloprotease FtsH [Acidimicrobiales bacterium]|nr:ATP-dependent zinc metalloprotease FtsH [Acidimicrobiales bacterium]